MPSNCGIRVSSFENLLDVSGAMRGGQNLMVSKKQRQSFQALDKLLGTCDTLSTGFVNDLSGCIEAPIDKGREANFSATKQRLWAKVKLSKLIKESGGDVKLYKFVKVKDKWIACKK